MWGRVEVDGDKAQRARRIHTRVTPKSLNLIAEGDSADRRSL